MPTKSKPLELSTLASPSLAGSELGLVQRRRDGRRAYRDALLASRRRGTRSSDERSRVGALRVETCIGPVRSRPMGSCGESRRSQSPSFWAPQITT